MMLAAGQIGSEPQQEKDFTAVLQKGLNYQRARFFRKTAS
jgi:hypothetical protein